MVLPDDSADLGGIDWQTSILGDSYSRYYYIDVTVTDQVGSRDSIIERFESESRFGRGWGHTT